MSKNLYMSMFLSLKVGANVCSVSYFLCFVDVCVCLSACLFYFCVLECVCVRVNLNPCYVIWLKQLILTKSRLPKIDGVTG